MKTQKSEHATEVGSKQNTYLKNNGPDEALDGNLVARAGAWLLC